MSNNKITGKVISESKEVCTINVNNFEGKSQTKIDVYDKDDNASVGDYIIASKIVNPMKDKKWKLIQILQKVSPNNTST